MNRDTSFGVTKPLPQHKMASMEKTSWTETDGAKVLVIACFIFLFFFHSARAFEFGFMNWQTDQGCYLQHLGDYIGIEGEHLCKAFAYGKNDHANGVALIWILPGLIGKLIAHLRHEDVTFWVLPFAGLSSYACWVTAIFAVLKILRLRAETLGLKWKWLPLFALFVIFNTYTLHYGTADVFLAHSAEIMLSFACAYFLLKDELLIALFFAVFLTVTRYNDAPVVLLLIGRWLDRATVNQSIRDMKLRSKVFLGTGSAALLGIGIWISCFRGYYGATLPSMLMDLQWANFREFLYSTHWGIIWSGSWWLAALLLGACYFMRLSYLARASVVWLALEALLVIVWGGNGTDFGNRYLSGSYSAALLVWLDLLELMPVRSWKQSAFRALTWANGTWVMLMTILYTTRPAMNPRWEGEVCFIPTNITGAMFMNLLNLDAYLVAFYRQIPAITLYYSYFPGRLPLGREFVRIKGGEWYVVFATTILCCSYLLVYGSAVLSRKLQPWRRSKLTIEGAARDSGEVI
jgi:hypothetical protein